MCPLQRTYPSHPTHPTWCVRRFLYATLSHRLKLFFDSRPSRYQTPGLSGGISQLDCFLHILLLSISRKGVGWTSVDYSLVDSIALQSFWSNWDGSFFSKFYSSMILWYYAYIIFANKEFNFMCGDYYLRTIDLWIMGPMRFLCAPTNALCVRPRDKCPPLSHLSVATHPR